MTKPIEWTTTEEQPKPADLVRHQRVKIETWITGPGYDSFLRDATPSDLVAALAAMGEGERAEVLVVAAAQGVPGAVAVRLAGSEEVIAKLKAERDEARLRCGSALATAATATARAEKAERAIADAGLERHGLRIKLEVAERERDEFRAATAVRDEQLALVRSQREKAERERDEARALESANRSALRGACAERDELRARLIAAETAAAQREPREYPLADGSWQSGWDVHERDGARISLSEDGILGASYDHGLVSARVLVYLADVLALAHRRGLV